MYDTELLKTIRMQNLSRVVSHPKELIFDGGDCLMKCEMRLLGGTGWLNETYIISWVLVDSEITHSCVGEIQPGVNSSVLHIPLL